jgi:hypothetical protein
MFPDFGDQGAFLCVLDAYAQKNSLLLGMQYANDTNDKSVGSHLTVKPVVVSKQYQLDSSRPRFWWMMPGKTKLIEIAK